MVVVVLQPLDEPLESRGRLCGGDSVAVPEGQYREVGRVEVHVDGGQELSRQGGCSRQEPVFLGTPGSPAMFAQLDCSPLGASCVERHVEVLKYRHLVGLECCSREWPSSGDGGDARQRIEEFVNDTSDP
jgi:hypothetical protein